MCLAARPNAVPDAGGTFADLKAHSENLGKSCREHTGPLIDHVENYPRRVRGLVLDSVFDHSLNTKKFSPPRRPPPRTRSGSSPRGVDATMHARCTSAMSVACSLKSLEDQTPAPARAADAAETAPFPVGSLCADHEFVISSERQWVSLWRKQSKVAPHMRSHFAWPLVSLCAAWPAQTPNPQHRTDVDGGPEILVMNSLHDRRPPTRGRAASQTRSTAACCSPTRAGATGWSAAATARSTPRTGT